MSGGYFLSYGSDVYRFYSLPPEEIMLEDSRNPMCEAFPRVASCTYYQYGSGGRQTALNALCILGLNIIIDKVYLVLWFWYVFLILCGLARIIIRSEQTKYFLKQLKNFILLRTECVNYLLSSVIGKWS